MIRAVKKLKLMADYRLFSDEVPIMNDITARHKELKNLPACLITNTGYPDETIAKQRAEYEGQLNYLKDEFYSLHNRYYSSVQSLWKFWLKRLALPPGSGEVVQSTVEELLTISENEPVQLTTDLWIFKGYEYQVEGLYSSDQFSLLILENFDRERQYFERLKHKYDANTLDTAEALRARIPETVRIEVWRRDDGKCSRCSSRERLEYDHIVPLSRGGSNTVRNIELLCEACNRAKGANIS